MKEDILEGEIDVQPNKDINFCFKKDKTFHSNSSLQHLSYLIFGKVAGVEPT